jgi:hypothetical protein
VGFALARFGLPLAVGATSMRFLDVVKERSEERLLGP